MIQIGALYQPMAMKHNRFIWSFGKLKYALFAGALFLSTMNNLVNNVMGLELNSVLKPIRYSNITFWPRLDKKSALQAFKRSCNQMRLDNRAFSKAPQFGGTKEDWYKVCEIAGKLKPQASDQFITDFFQDNFSAFQVHDPQIPQGLFTGYFEPEVEGSLTKTSQYNIPIYAKPDDLVRFDEKQQKVLGFGYGRIQNGKPVAYFTRKEIEQGALKNQGLELVWLKHRADAFFVQIQGSGRVRLPTGKSLRLGYAAKSGLPYTPIGKVLIAQGELDKKTISMQTIRTWLDKNPDKAQAMMWNNQSFVFFKILDDVADELGPVGAQNIHLTPHTSFAIDRRYWAFGTPMLLNLELELGESTKKETWQSLMIAQDTGSAIRGFARGDVFWGSGAHAALTAGKMKSQGTMIVLLPNSYAKQFIK